MKQHLGAVLTSSLAAIALGLALLQAAVLLDAAPVPLADLAAPLTHRSATQGRAAVPNALPGEAAPGRQRTTVPAPEGKPPEERRRLPPRQQRSFMPGQQPGPRPARKLAA